MRIYIKWSMMSNLIKKKPKTLLVFFSIISLIIEINFLPIPSINLFKDKHCT
jgi:hypothetical protein